jgi:hypothetical protein
VAKAQTIALSYAWMPILNISTGEDPEADAHEDELAETTKLEKCLNADLLQQWWIPKRLWAGR